MEHTFTIKGAFKEAAAVIRPKFWQVARQYAWIILGFMLLSMLGGSNLLLGILISSMFAYVTALASLGYAKHGTYSLGQFMKALSFQSFAYFFLAFAVSKLFIVAGMILLVVPGVMLAVWLCFVKFIAAEREIGPWDACQESARLTRGNRWKLFGFFVLAGLLNVLGFVCLVVGLLYTIPLTLIALAIIYRKLKEAKDFTPEIVEVVETEAGEAIEAPAAEVV